MIDTVPVAELWVWRSYGLEADPNGGVQRTTPGYIYRHNED